MQDIINLLAQELGSLYSMLQLQFGLEGAAWVVLLIVLFGAFFLYSLYQFHQAKNLASNGIETDAVVLDIVSEEGEPDIYHIQYRTRKGQMIYIPYTPEESTDNYAQLYKPLKAGDHFPIVYLEKKPKTFIHAKEVQTNLKEARSHSWGVLRTSLFYFYFICNIFFCPFSCPFHKRDSCFFPNRIFFSIG